MCVTGPWSSQLGAEAGWGGSGWRLVEEVTNLSRRPQFHFPPPWEVRTLSFPLSVCLQQSSSLEAGCWGARHRCLLRAGGQAGLAGGGCQHFLSPPPLSTLRAPSAGFRSPNPTAQGTSSPLWGRTTLGEDNTRGTERGGTTAGFQVAGWGPPSCLLRPWERGSSGKTRLPPPPVACCPPSRSWKKDRLTCQAGHTHPRALTSRVS